MSILDVIRLLPCSFSDGFSPSPLSWRKREKKGGIPAAAVKDFVAAIHPHIMRHGWRKGNREFYRTCPAWEKAKGVELSLFSSRQSVWKLLLPGCFDTDLLIADASLGAAPLDLSKSYRRVIVCPWYERSADIVRKRVEEAGVSNIHVCDRVDAGELRGLDCSIGTSIVVVTGDVLAFLGERGVRDRISEVLQTIREFCSRAWTNIVLFPKKYRLDPSMRFLSLFHQAGMSTAVLKKDGMLYGQRRAATYHFRHAPEHVSEIDVAGFNALRSTRVSHALFFSSPKPFSLKEEGISAIRHFLNAVKRSPFSYSSQMLALSRGERSSTWLEGFLSHLRKRDAGGGGLGVRRYIAGNPNMILLELTADSGLSSICRMPLGRGAATIRRARNNYSALQGLQSCGVLSGLSPRPLDHGVYHGQEYYIETFLYGEKLHLTPVNYAQVYAMVRPALLSFYLDAGRDTIIDEPVFQSLVGESLAMLKSHAINRDDMKKIRALEHALQDIMLNARLRLPLVHGDFKIENMLFRSGRLTGIIDWDLSMFSGLPYLDLLYLYGYSFHHSPLTNGRGIMHFILKGLMHRDFGPVLQEWYDDYSSTLKLPALWNELSVVLFWLHYVTRTIGMAMYSYNEKTYERNIRAPLEVIAGNMRQW